MKKLTHSLLGFIACALLLGSCNPMDCPSHLSAVLLNEHSITLDGGSSSQLSFSTTPQRFVNGDITVTWESNKPQVVSVSETGNLEALKAGFATIKVTVVSKDVTLKDSCRVAVISGDIYFADPAFEASCVSSFDTNGDGAVSTDEAAEADYMGCSFLTIVSLEGIEFFPAISTLHCVGNDISSLDLSHNPNLEELYCFDNNLVSLNLELNTSLRTLRCMSNYLTQLDLSNNPALETVSCSSNSLTTMDVSNNPALISLNCIGNPHLTELWLKTGQTIDELVKSYVTVVKYK